MKITVNVECTPGEARSFLGLPDVAPMQEAMLQQMYDRMMSNLHAVEPETLFKTWFPVGAEGMERLNDEGRGGLRLPAR